MKLLFQNSGVNLFAPPQATGKGDSSGSGGFAALLASITGKLAGSQELKGIKSEEVLTSMPAGNEVMAASILRENGVVAAQLSKVKESDTADAGPVAFASVVIENTDGAETVIPVTVRLVEVDTSSEDSGESAQAMLLIAPSVRSTGNDSETDTEALLKKIFGDSLVVNEDGSMYAVVPLVSADSAVAAAAASEKTIEADVADDALFENIQAAQTTVESIKVTTPGMQSGNGNIRTVSGEKPAVKDIAASVADEASAAEIRKDSADGGSSASGVAIDKPRIDMTAVSESTVTDAPAVNPEIDISVEAVPADVSGDNAKKADVTAESAENHGIGSSAEKSQAGTTPVTASVVEIDIPPAENTTGTVRLRFDIPESMLHDIDAVNEKNGAVVSGDRIAGLMKALSNDGGSIDAAFTVNDDSAASAVTVESPVITISSPEGDEHTAEKTAVSAKPGPSLTAVNKMQERAQHVSRNIRTFATGTPDEKAAGEITAESAAKTVASDGSGTVVTDETGVFVSSESTSAAMKNSGVADTQKSDVNPGNVNRTIDVEMTVDSKSSERATDEPRPAIVETAGGPDISPDDSEQVTQYDAQRKTAENRSASSQIETAETVEKTAAQETGKDASASDMRNVHEPKMSDTEKYTTAVPEPDADGSRYEVKMKSQSGTEIISANKTADGPDNAAGEQLVDSVNTQGLTDKDNAKADETAVHSKTETASEKTAAGTASEIKTADLSVDKNAQTDEKQSRTAHTIASSDDMPATVEADTSEEVSSDISRTASVSSGERSRDAGAKSDMGETSSEARIHKGFEHPSFKADTVSETSFKDRAAPVSDKQLQMESTSSAERSELPETPVVSSAQASGRFAENETPEVPLDNRSAHVMGKIRPSVTTVSFVADDQGGTPETGLAETADNVLAETVDTMAVKADDAASADEPMTKTVDKPSLAGVRFNRVMHSTEQVAQPGQKSDPAVKDTTPLSAADTHDIPANTVDRGNEMSTQENTIPGAMAASAGNSQIVTESRHSATPAHKSQEASLEQNTPQAVMFKTGGNADSSLSGQHSGGESSNRDSAMLFKSHSVDVTSEKSGSETENISAGNSEFKTVIENLQKSSGISSLPSEAREMEDRVFESVVRHAKIMLGRGSSNAVLTLDPPSLGKVRLEIVTEQSKVSGRITVENHEVKEIIEHRLNELNESLAKNGLKVERFDVQVGHNSGTDSWARREDAERTMKHIRNQHSNGVLRNSAAASAVDPVSAARKIIHNGMIDLMA